MPADRRKAAPAAAANPELDRRLMAAALRLGRRNLGRTWPNPAVGALVVHMQDGNAIVVGRGAMQLVLGGPPFRRKLDQAARVVAELDKRGAKADSIMLDNDTRPERVVVRMR